ncbi:MAG: cytochrome c oxidase assembly protein [Acidimicrobiia bacterium]|nr:cytochrome c oxidase assembly protein [Acidimicrobiia bacterium]MDH5520556.1 cytochrome c oxidase assembly protein [Acidimicrobiia bacterium]
MLAVTVPYEAHVEVWTLIAGAIALGLYGWRVLQPKALAAGYDPISRRQAAWFVGAVASMWVFSDWPIHEIAEQYLYAVHMVQHFFLSMLIPAMFLLATPRWIVELVAPPGSRAWRLLKSGSRPIVAGVVFNALTVLLHWSVTVRLSFEIGAFHFLFHLMIFAAGLLMWMPIISPVVEWRIPPVAKCIYLFVMSIIPTVPSGWLIFAEDVVYRNYDIPERLWGIGVMDDQTAAGLVMKLLTGFFLWGTIFVIFIRWANEEMRADEERRNAPLTVDRISDEFALSDPVPETVPPGGGRVADLGPDSAEA